MARTSERGGNLRDPPQNLEQDALYVQYSRYSVLIVLSSPSLRKSSWSMTNLSLLAYLAVGLVCKDFLLRPEQYNSLSGRFGRIFAECTLKI